MGARWLQAKEAKRRKAYKGKPRRVYNPTDPHAIRTRSLAQHYVEVQYVTQRVRGKMEIKKLVDVYSPAELAVLHAIYPAGYREVSAERKDVLTQIRALEQSDFRQKVITYNSVALIVNRRRILRMFFAGLEFFFIEANLEADSIKRSIVYSSRDRAMRAFENNRITYIELMFVNSPSPVPG